MSDIFISYAKEDHPWAEMLAQTLKDRGWLTFWDRTIPTGKTWRETIGRELEGARCVIVLWSKTSIESDWVQEEADAKRRRVLVPVLIDKVHPPYGFSEYSGRAPRKLGRDGTNTGIRYLDCRYRGAYRAASKKTRTAAGARKQTSSARPSRGGGTSLRLPH
jgi:hypothetical protein